MGPGPAGISQLEYMFSRIVCVSVPLGYIALLVILVIAGIKYLISGGEPKAISQAHQTVTWGLLGICFLAISWLILQLIQNFTGIGVTKFTLTSLPGVQGFSGSCWAEAPVAPTVTPSTVTRCKTEKDNVSGIRIHKVLCPCKDSELVFDKLNPEQQTMSIVYNPSSLSELAKINDRPAFINILDGAEPEALRKSKGVASLYQAGAGKSYEFNKLSEQVPLLSRYEALSLGVLEKLNEGNLLVPYDVYAKFPKNTLPSSFIKALYDSQQIAKHRFVNINPGTTSESWGMLDGVYIRGYSCNDGDYYSIAALSPLVYFYPTQTTKIQAQIKSPILSKYGNSWNFTTFPNGQIKLLQGSILRFIPYEFLRRDFKRPEQGLVVNSEHLIGYLRDDLWKKLGLTNQEIEDYWDDLKSRIPDSPYYFISLIDRSEIDRVLPMEVNPKPDTIIRNMTYILPLSSPYIPIPLPNIKAPDRKGFTVLENGGFIDGL